MKIKTDDFNLEATLDSGQVFGFSKNSEGRYEGVIEGIPIKLKQDRDYLFIETSENQIPEVLIRNYFDLDHNLENLYSILCRDDCLMPAYRHFKGLRIIRQDPWEALACFIISSNNNIKRIRLIRQNLLRAFVTNRVVIASPEGAKQSQSLEIASPDQPSGTGRPSGRPPLDQPASASPPRNDASAFSFPEPSEIARSDEPTLRRLGLGYRGPFLLSAAKRVAADGASFNRIQNLGYEEAKAYLMQFPGVGPKVADCALLFGFQKYEAFPVDVWVYRTVRKLYFRNRKLSEQRIRAFGQKRWGKNAGFVQQYLYHGAKCGLL